MNKTLAMATFVLSFILIASLVSKTLDQTVLAQDLSTIKDAATKLLNGNDHKQGTNNNSTSSATENSTSGGSLTDKATGIIGGLLK